MGNSTNAKSAQESVEPAQFPRPYDRVVKLVIAGCSWTTMPDHFINKSIGYGYEPTPISNLKCEFRSHTLVVDAETVRLQIWDVSMYVRFRCVSPALFRGRHVGFMILYDVRDESSFETAKELLALSQHAGEIPTVLVGCQCQEEERRQVSYHIAREFADERNIPVVEVCGKEGVNVELAFMTLVGELLSRKRFIE